MAFSTSAITFCWFRSVLLCVCSHVPNTFTVFKCTIQWHIVMQPSPLSISRTLPSPQTETSLPVNNNFPLLPPPSPSVQFSSVQFSRSVVSDSLRPHEPQHSRPPCPSPTPGVHSNSIESVMPSSHLILCRPLLLLPPIPPSIRVFSNESTLRMRWPKYWSSQPLGTSILYFPSL